MNRSGNEDDHCSSFQVTGLIVGQGVIPRSITTDLITDQTGPFSRSRTRSGPCRGFDRSLPFEVCVLSRDTYHECALSQNGMAGMCGLLSGGVDFSNIKGLRAIKDIKGH